MAWATSCEEYFTKIGVKFKPTDSTLVDHFLAGKICGSVDGPGFQRIKEVDVYQCEPEQLSSYEPHDFGDNPRKYYFFTTVKMIKTGEGKNVDRLVKHESHVLGFWRMTGKIVDVKDEDDNNIGTKTSLAYHIKKGKNEKKTNWLMTEYRLGDKKYETLKKECNIVDEEHKRLALCVVYDNDKKRRKCESKHEIELDDEISSVGPVQLAAMVADFENEIRNAEAGPDALDKLGLSCYVDSGSISNHPSPFGNGLDKPTQNSNPYLSLCDFPHEDTNRLGNASCSDQNSVMRHHSELDENLVYEFWSVDSWPELFQV